MLKSEELMRKFLLALIIIVSGSLAADSSEKGVPTSPLVVYSGGIGAGSIFSLNDELSDESEQFLKLSFINSIHLQNNISMFLDLDWFIPGDNYGADLGFDFFLSQSAFRPLIGLGVGAHSFDKKGSDFGQTIGMSGTAHLGFLLDLTENMQIRVRVPYHFVANSTRDHAVGLDIGFLFSDKFRKVKKLNY